MTTAPVALFKRGFDDPHRLVRYAGRAAEILGKDEHGFFILGWAVEWCETEDDQRWALLLLAGGSSRELHVRNEIDDHRAVPV